MADVRDDQRRYLAARLAACETRPDLNAHQIAEYRRYLHMLASSADAGDYADRVARSGDMFSIAQAEQLDRYTNTIALKRRFGDEVSARGLAVCLEAARAATGHLDLVEKMQAATKDATEAMNAAHRALNLVATLIPAVVVAHTRSVKNRGAAADAVKKVWADLTEAGPGITWEKLTAYPPYRSIIIFDDARMAALKQWFEEAIA